MAADTNLKQRVLSVLIVGERCSGDNDDNHDQQNAISAHGLVPSPVAMVDATIRRLSAHPLSPDKHARAAGRPATAGNIAAESLLMARRITSLSVAPDLDPINAQADQPRDSPWEKVVEDFVTEPISPELSYRGLRSSVVLQALEDIESEPTQSLDFADAVAFFTRSGSWAGWRTTIADFLDMHRDELEGIGRRCIDARRSMEELPSGARQRSPGTLCVTPLRLARLLASRQGARPNTSGSRTTPPTFVPMETRLDPALPPM